MTTTDRRRLIVQAAAQSFAQFGYKATTMDLVAKIANVGKGTTYTFFSTKEELFEEIIRKALQELKETLEKRIRAEAPFSENLFHALDLLLEYRSDHELFVKLAQEVRDVGTPQAQEAIKKLENVVLDYLRQHLDQAIAKREVRECDTQVTSFMLVKLYIALTSEWNRSRETLSKEQIKNHIWLFVSEGLIVKASD